MADRSRLKSIVSMETKTRRRICSKCFKEVLQRHRSPGVTFALHLHLAPEMHDRFILTDRGGIQIGQGLDDNEEGDHPPTANVILLDHAIFQRNGTGSPAEHRSYCKLMRNTSASSPRSRGLFVNGKASDR